MINIRLNKKNDKKKKPTCGYREIWICQAISQIKRFSEKLSEGHDNFVLGT